MQPLYELANEYLQLIEWALDEDVDEKAIADTFDSINAEIEAKADAYGKIMRSLNADAKGIDEEIKRLTGRKEHIEKSVKGMKDRLQAAMELTGKKKFKTALFSFYFQKNPASVVIDVEDVHEIPDEFLRHKEPEPDKTKIKDAIDAGEKVSFAHLTQTESLRIR